jgi:hypothetical protein
MKLSCIPEPNQHHPLDQIELFKFQLNFGQTFIFFFSSLLLSLSLLQTDQGGKP